MKNFALIVALLVASNSIAQTEKLSAQQWQEDLRFLQETIHTKYRNLFHKVTAEQFDSAVVSFQKRIPSLESHEAIVEFARLIAFFRIGHTRITGTNTNRHSSGGQTLFSRLPIQFYMFSDGLYVRSARKDFRDAVGGRVTGIGKVSIEQAVELVRPIVTAENEMNFLSNLPMFLSFKEVLHATGVTDESERVPITYVKDGKKRTIVMEDPDRSEFRNLTGISLPDDWIDASLRTEGGSPLWRKEPDRFRYFEYLPRTRTVYVRHSVTLDDSAQTLKAFFDRVFDFVDSTDVQKFILDIRLNGGGNNYLNKPIIAGIIRSGKINVRGKLFCVIGRRTFSAAQNLVNELEKYTEVTFVGEPTGENVNFYGDTRKEELPKSALQVSLSWLWWQNMDPRDNRQWTAPELATPMSFNDYLNNRDPALEAIEEFSGENARVSVVNSILALVKKGDSEEAFALGGRYCKNPKHQYAFDRVEVMLNDSGYRRMNEKQFAEASALFRINTRLFPASANAYDSFGESLWQLGKTDEAIAQYEIAISKDPRGPTGENARKMISQIQGRNK